MPFVSMGAFFTRELEMSDTFDLIVIGTGGKSCRQLQSWTESVSSSIGTTIRRRIFMLSLPSIAAKSLSNHWN